MKHRMYSHLRFLMRYAAAAFLVGGAWAGATDYNLMLTKTADVSSVAAGGAVKFTINVGNASNAPYAATNVVIDDMLPKGFKLVSASPTYSSVNTTSDPKIAQYFFDLGTIRPGSTKTITVQAVGVAPSAITAPSINSQYNYRNIAQVASVDNPNYDTSGSRPNNCSYLTMMANRPMEDDCSAVDVRVADMAYPQLTLTKTGNGPWTAGQSGANYTLTVSNLGNVATTGPITVQDRLPDGVSLANLSLPAGWNSSVSGSLVTLTNSSGILSAGGSVTLNLPVSIGSSAASSITNKAAVGGGGDPDPLPDPATCTVGTSNPNNQCASYTTSVTVNSGLPVTCTNMYAMVITNTVKDGSGNPILYNGGQIQRLDELSNTLTGGAITLPGGATSATLAIAPDGAQFFTADDNNKLRIFNVSSKSWSTGGTFTGVSDRLVRMAMAPDGTGYAMDASGNFWTFTQGGSVTPGGKLASTSSSAPSFYANGDFFATADNKMYMLSAQTSGTVSLWYVNPANKTAEYLGDLPNKAASNVQFNGLAATPNGIFAANSAGQLGKIDPAVLPLTVSPVGGTTTGSTDLASCYYPHYKPNVSAVKSVAKVAGSAGSDVHPGDTLEYTVTVRNSGNLPAGGALFHDALPAGTTYVPGSAKVNGFSTTNTAGATTNLSGSAYPFATPVGICSLSTSACTNQVLKADSTPDTLDNEAVMTFRVTVNDCGCNLSAIKNKAGVTYNDGNTPPTNIPTNETTTPVAAYPQLTIAKTSNVAGGSWALGQTGAAYTLTITNASTYATFGTITVKDLLPAGLAPLTSSFTPAPGWNCTTTNQLITCTTSNVIEANQNAAFDVPVSIGAAALGSVTNKAVVGGGGDPDPLPDPATCTVGSSNPNNQCASNTVTITGSTNPAQCTNLYGLMLPPGAPAYPADGTTIQVIGDTDNALGSVVATLPDKQKSATLAVSPDGKKFFTAADSASSSIPLLIYDTATAQWSAGSNFTLTSTANGNRLVRMTVAQNGTGYAMDSSGTLYSFQTAAPYSTATLGKVIPASTSGTHKFALSGDMFATSKGLYVLSSVDGTASIDLWLITPSTLSAEYLGGLKDPGQANAQYNGFAATPNGVFGRDNYGRLVKIDLQHVTLQPVGSVTTGSTDLASCYYPSFAPNIGATKTVKKVAGSEGAAVYPGDTLEYTITVRNTGDLPAGGVNFQDSLPAGTTYVAGSATVNGATTTITNGTVTNLTGAAYPFGTPVGICSYGLAPCTSQVLNIDSTPGITDNEAVIIFRVKVADPFTLSPSQVSNQAVIKYMDGPAPGVPSDDPTTPAPHDPTVTPVVKPVKIVAEKTVQNITAGTPVATAGNGKPGDVLEYCIKTSNIGSLNATHIHFGDNVPANTTFLVGAYGASKDIHVTSSTGLDTYYTSAQDADQATLLNGLITVDGGSFVLQPQQNFTVCFRATIQ